ncbi:MAG: hypothetical protein ACLU3F_15605 [Blautia wexlerae]
MSITLEQVKQSEEITSYIRKADESLSALGFTEHSFAHVGLVSAQASAILKTLGYDDRTCELAAIAGWLHDIGNVINRIDHAQSGAVMAFRILDKMGAAPRRPPPSSPPSAITTKRPPSRSTPWQRRSSWRIRWTCARTVCGRRPAPPSTFTTASTTPSKARGHAHRQGDLSHARYRHGGVRGDRVF